MKYPAGIEIKTELWDISLLFGIMEDDNTMEIDFDYDFTEAPGNNTPQTHPQQPSAADQVCKFYLM